MQNGNSKFDKIMMIHINFNSKYSVDILRWIEITEWEKKTSRCPSNDNRTYISYDYWDRKMILYFMKSKNASSSVGRNSLEYHVKFNTTLVNPKSMKANPKPIKFELKDASEIQQDDFQFKNEFLVITFDPGNKLSNFDVKANERNGNDYEFECDVEISLKTIGSEYQVIRNVGNTPIFEAMSEILESGKFSDFKIIAKGKEFKVHRNILSLASPVFATMFEIDLDEKKLNCATVDCDPEIFQHLLEFIYSGKLPENFADVAIKLYEVAHLYQIESLVKYCVGYVLSKEINEENALDIYEFAVKFRIDDLFDRSWAFIRW